ncbi:hypothetical protein M514_07183 [Trichuris suis]|uniref:Uncharacterized protein n=1 Tax=Trichuris suis TaxID=68888 RepID=A0A085NBZ8_9BILA|nr:hypothetical protein M513_07183 [Trichuris suis]KFD66994.1 hypothetical protein M514_07183 [Trichuris suis]
MIDNTAKIAEQHDLNLERERKFRAGLGGIPVLTGNYKTGKVITSKSRIQRLFSSQPIWTKADDEPQPPTFNLQKSLLSRCHGGSAMSYQ